MGEVRAIEGLQRYTADTPASMGIESRLKMLGIDVPKTTQIPSSRWPYAVDTRYGSSYWRTTEAAAPGQCCGLFASKANTCRLDQTPLEVIIDD